jgi:hypothetical protein
MAGSFVTRLAEFVLERRILIEGSFYDEIGSFSVQLYLLAGDAGLFHGPDAD